MFGRRKKKSIVPAEGLVIGEEDVMQGTLRAEVVTVGGRVEGTIEVATTLIVAPSGHVSGSMRAARLVIEPGAVIRAVCRVGIPADAADPMLAVPAPGAERAGVLRLTPRSTRAVGAAPVGGPAAVGG